MLPLSQNDSALVLIDFQERLAQAIPEPVLQSTVKHAKVLLSAAKLLRIPLVITEQYSRGLGPTLVGLKEFSLSSPIDKISFAATLVPEFDTQLKQLNRQRIVLMGMETHICVLQTAVGLKNQGYDVWIAADAVCSRRQENWTRGLELANHFGIYVAPTESIVFAWLERAGTLEFKTLSTLIRDL